MVDMSLFNGDYRSFDAHSMFYLQQLKYVEAKTKRCPITGLDILCYDVHLLINPLCSVVLIFMSSFYLISFSVYIYLF
jgi:hypothetical protein